MNGTDRDPNMVLIFELFGRISTTKADGLKKWNELWCDLPNTATIDPNITP